MDFISKIQLPNGDDYLLKTETISTASGSIANFSTSLEMPLVAMSAEIVAQQAGTGTPSPSNPRSISGVSSVGLTKCGKNFYPIKIGRDLFADNRGASHTTNDDILTITMDSQNNSGVFGGNSSTLNNQVCQTIKKFSGSFVLSLYAKASQNNSDVYFGFTSFYNTVATLSTNWQKVEVPMTLDSAIHILNFYNRSGSAITVDVKDLQIEIGSTATAYEPYSTETKTISLGQTIYGGSGDCINGNASKTYEIVEYDGSDDENWSYLSSGYIIERPTNAKTSNESTPLCNMAQLTTSSNVPDGYFRIGNSYVVIRLGTGDSDVSAFKQFLSNNHLVIVYEMITPTEITGLTPANFTTFEGVNNIFADCGDISVSYFNSGASDTEKLIETVLVNFKQEIQEYIDAKIKEANNDL